MTESGPVLAEDGAILTAIGVSKSFGGVHALTDVDLTLERGTVLAIAGENGAGKSTLIKIMTGVYQPDAGTISIDGRTQTLSPASARSLGIAAVAQELSVLDHQSVAENITWARRRSTAWASSTGGPSVPGHRRCSIGSAWQSVRTRWSAT